MSECSIAKPRVKFWLVSRSGPFAGVRLPLPEGPTRVGRAPDNLVVVEGDNASTVSLYHVEISHNGASCHVRDLGSTNGTWVNDERVTEADIAAPATIRLGTQGPEFSTDRGRSRSRSPRSHYRSSAFGNGQSGAPESPYEKLLSGAVARAQGPPTRFQASSARLDKLKAYPTKRAKL